MIWLTVLEGEVGKDC